MLYSTRYGVPKADPATQQGATWSTLLSHRSLSKIYELSQWCIVEVLAVRPNPSRLFRRNCNCIKSDSDHATTSESQLTVSLQNENHKKIHLC